MSTPKGDEEEVAQYVGGLTSATLQGVFRDAGKNP